MGHLPKFEDLEIEKKLLVLGWARDSIDSGMKQQVSKKSYQAFVTALHSNTPFSMADIWDSLPESTRDHFEHASDIMLHLDDEIDKFEDYLERESDESDPDPGVDDDPFKDVPDENDGDA